MTLTVKNWRVFQHYKDRSPPWIRLHKALLDNMDFNALPPMACKVLVLLWLVASDNTEGRIPDDADQIAFRLRLPVKDVRQALQTLEQSGFLLRDDAASHDDDGAPLSAQIAARNGFGSRHISDVTKRFVWERDQGKCQHCQSTDSLEFDHVHPVSKGGNSEPENVQLLCRPCNRKKRVKTAEQVATPAQPWLDIRTSEAEAEAEAEGGAKAPVAKASKRVPEGFAPDRDMALREIPDLDVDREVQKFRDWEFKTARKDWPAVWRTWIGNARDSGKYAKRSNGKADPYARAI
jgi:hypothetical protein